jgi:hypothetical protein
MREREQVDTWLSRVEIWTAALELEHLPFCFLNTKGFHGQAINLTPNENQIRVQEGENV